MEDEDVWGGREIGERVELETKEGKAAQQTHESFSPQEEPEAETRDEETIAIFTQLRRE